MAFYFVHLPGEGLSTAFDHIQLDWINAEVWFLGIGDFQTVTAAF